MLAVEKLDCGRNKGKAMLQPTKRHLSCLCQVYREGILLLSAISYHQFQSSRLLYRWGQHSLSPNYITLN